MTTIAGFARRTKERSKEAREVLAELRKAGRKATKRLLDLAEQQDRDALRVSEKIAEIAEDAEDALTQDATDVETEGVHAFQREVDDLVGEIEEIPSFRTSAEDLQELLTDGIDEIQSYLDEAENPLAIVEGHAEEVGV